MIKEIIYDSLDEVRLDSYLKLKFSDLSRTKIQKLIKNASIKVDNFIVKPSFKLKGDNIITYDNSISIKVTSKVSAENIPIDLIYEDEDLIVINKPSGLVVHPGAGNLSGTLLNGLMYYYKDSLSKLDINRPGIIHRLDKETSGVILVAKTDYMHYSISNQFADRKVKKKYKALVWGRLTTDKNEIEGYIARNNKNRIAYKLTANKGKYSFSKYEVKQNFVLPFSLINVYPSTGRTHQIRVHFSSIGNPIIYDDLYQGGVDKIKSFDSNLKNDIKKSISKINRVALHAEQISFYHPVKKKDVIFTAPVPDDMMNTIKILESYE